MHNFINWILESLGFRQPVDRPDPSDPCSAVECVDAKRRLESERKSFVRICWWVQALKAILNFLDIFTATPIWIVGVLIAMAIFFGIFFPPLALLIWAAIAVWAFSWLFKIALTPVYAQIVGVLAMQRLRVEEAIAVVIKNCPEQCRGDVSAPECRLP